MTAGRGTEVKVAILRVAADQTRLLAETEDGDTETERGELVSQRVQETRRSL